METNRRDTVIPYKLLKQNQDRWQEFSRDRYSKWNNRC